MTITSAMNSSVSAAPSHGTTSLTTRAIERIAEQAALEVPCVGADAGGVLGVGARHDFGAPPSASASLYGDVVVLRFEIGVAFPRPLDVVLSRLRTHVRDRVEHLTGLAVGRMDVSVTWLHPGAARAKVLA